MQDQQVDQNVPQQQRQQHQPRSPSKEILGDVFRMSPRASPPRTPLSPIPMFGSHGDVGSGASAGDGLDFQVHHTPGAPAAHACSTPFPGSPPRQATPAEDATATDPFASPTRPAAAAAVSVSALDEEEATLAATSPFAPNRFTSAAVSPPPHTSREGEPNWVFPNVTRALLNMSPSPDPANKRRRRRPHHGSSSDSEADEHDDDDDDDQRDHSLLDDDHSDDCLEPEERDALNSSGYHSGAADRCYSCSSLEFELRTARRKAHRQSQEIKEMTAELINLREDNNEYKAEYENLMSQGKELYVTYTTRCNQLKMVQSQCTTHEKRIKLLEAQLAESKAESETERSAREALKTQSREKTKMFGGAFDQFKNLTEIHEQLKLEHAGCQAMASQVEELKAHVRQLQQQLDQSDACSDVADDAAAAAAAAAATSHRVEALVASNELLREERDAMIARVEASQEKMDTMEAEVERYRGRIEQLEDAAVAAKQREASLAHEVRQRDTKVAEAEAQVAQARARITALQEEAEQRNADTVAAAQQGVEAQRELLQQAQADLLAVEQRRQELQQALQQAKVEIDAQKGQVRNLEADLALAFKKRKEDMARFQHENYRQRYADAIREKCALQQQVQVLTHVVQESTRVGHMHAEEHSALQSLGEGLHSRLAAVQAHHEQWEEAMLTAAKAVAHMGEQRDQALAQLRAAEQCAMEAKHQAHKTLQEHEVTTQQLRERAEALARMEAQCAEWRDRFAAAKDAHEQQLESMEAELFSVTENLCTKEAEAEALGRRAVHAEVECEHHRQACDALRVEVELLNQALLQVTAVVPGEQGQEGDHGAEVRQWGEDLRVAHATVFRLQAAVDSLHARLGESQAKVGALQAQAWYRSVDAQRCDTRLQRDLELARSETEVAHSERGQVQQALEAEHQVAHALRAERDHSDALAETLRIQLEQCQAQLSEATAGHTMSLADAEAKIADARQAHDSKVAELEARVHEHETLLQQAELEAQRLRCELEDSQGKVEQLQHVLQQQSEAAKVLACERDNFSTAYTARLQDVDLARKHADTLKAALVTEHERAQRLEAEAEATQTSLHSLTDAVKHLKLKCELMTNDKQRMSIQLAAMKDLITFLDESDQVLHKSAAEPSEAQEVQEAVSSRISVVQDMLKVLTLQAEAFERDNVVADLQERAKLWQSKATRIHEIAIRQHEFISQAKLEKRELVERAVELEKRVEKMRSVVRAVVQRLGSLPHQLRESVALSKIFHVLKRYPTSLCTQLEDPIAIQAYVTNDGDGSQTGKAVVTQDEGEHDEESGVSGGEEW